MKIFITLLLLLYSFFQPDLLSQVILYEGFESGVKPEGWTQEYVVGQVNWRYRNGGYNPSDPNLDYPITPNGEEDIARNPSSPLEGNYNAFFFNQGDDNSRTKLITPELNLLGASAVRLGFYLCQIPWTFEGSTGWDIMRVYYRISPNDPWIILNEYLDPIYEWEKQVLNLPNPSETYYLAFEGHARWGFGTLIDSVIIEETGTQQLYVADIEMHQASSFGVPSGSVDAPVLRADIKVYGNTGALSLNQITFTSLNSSDADIFTNGVKLYSTATQEFSTDNLLGSPTGFSSGKAIFNSLNYSLMSGHNYLWLSYDIVPGAVHKNKLDARILANDVVTSSGTYPAADLSPPGEAVIYYTHYYDGFEGTADWELTGEFQMGTPGGLGGNPGNPDPTAAFRGSNVLGTDLTFNGNYEADLTASTADKATSKNINVLYYKDLNLFFMRYLNIEVWDYAAIEVSNNGGYTWKPVWESNAYINDFNWNLERIPIPREFWRSDSLKIRFRLGPTSAFNNYSGWNIDDVYLTGEFISKDVGVSEWISPQSGSGLTSSESVTIRIKNYGGTAITEPVPVAYSFNGGKTWTIDQMDTDIPVNGSVEFTFPTKTDLSQPGPRSSVIARTLLPGDQHSSNDRLDTEIFVVPTYTPPFEEDFEKNDGYWRSLGFGLWEHGTPAGTMINSAASGSQSWVTGLSSDYGDLLTGSNEILFEDGFETNLGWSFTGEFERGMPDGINLPWYPFYGYYCMGTDVVGHGDSLFKYENGITDLTAYTATSPPINLSNYSNVQLSYARWIQVQQGDSVKMEISADNGNTWNLLWSNNGAEIMEEWWSTVLFDIPSEYIYTSEFRIRFSLNYSSPDGEVAAGWNIDDIMLTGYPVSYDQSHLSSPRFDLSGVLNPMITANLWIDTEAGVDGIHLQYSLDDGVNWTAISNVSGYDDYWNWYTGQPVTSLSGSGWSGQTGEWIPVRHLLPASVAGKSNVQLRFTFAADKAQNQYEGIAVDDVRIIEAPVNADLVAIVDPISSCELGSDQRFTLTVKNSGISAIETDDSLQIVYLIEHPEGIQMKEEIYYMQQSLATGNTLNITTGSKFNFSEPGEYMVTVYLQFADPYIYSQVSSDTVFSVIEVNKPYLELGGVISTSQPDTVVLDANPKGVAGQSYVWQDGSTNSIYNVSTNGKYWVTVTKSPGCSASDTVIVQQLFPDIGVTAFSGPQSGCEVAPGLPLEVTIKNLGNDTLNTGVGIIIGGIINRGEPFYDTVILVQSFRPGEQFTHTYNDYLDFSSPGSYQIQMFTILTSDEKPENDTLSYNLEVYGYPDASLGDDISINAMEYILTPESGHSSYNWQDGSTGETYKVDQPGTGTYYVTITNKNMCISSDTIVVTLNVTDLEISQLLSPSGACEFSNEFNISTLVTNSGNQTIASGQIVNMGYIINQGNKIVEQFFINKDLLPGESFIFEFSNVEIFPPDQWYLFKVFVNHGPDINRENDTITSLVNIFDTSPVDLGEDRIETGLSYTLDAGPDFVSYQWQDGSTIQTFTITSPGIGVYHVTVEDMNGCVASDTVNIMLSVPDIGVTEISQPQTACHLDSDLHVQIAVKNLGNYQINPLATIYVSYVVNDGPVITEPLILEDTMKSGEWVYHTFAKVEDFSVPGSYDIVAYTIYEADLSPVNNSHSVKIDHYGPVLKIGTEPEVVLDSDTLVVYAPQTLVAHQPYSSYDHQWQDGSTGSEFSISVPSVGWYWIEAEGDFGCTGSDSLYVIFDLPDVGISNLISPVNTCAEVGLTPVSFEIVNHGFMDITPEDELTITYSVNGSSSRIEKIHLDENLPSGNSTIVTFSQKFDFSSPGTYNINTSVIYTKDINYTNNTLTSDVNIWEAFFVDIGGGDDTLRTSLPVTLDPGSGFASYLWQDGSEGSTQVAAEYGLYWVEVTNNLGCLARDSVVVWSATGSVNVLITADQIRLYPNPVKGILHVDLTLDQERKIILEFYSTLNQLLYREEMDRVTSATFNVNVQQFVSGIYTLRIISDGIPHAYRVIVQ